MSATRKKHSFLWAPVRVSANVEIGGKGGCHYHWTKHSGSQILPLVNPATTEDTPLSEGVFFSCRVESLNSFFIQNWLVVIQIAQRTKHASAFVNVREKTNNWIQPVSKAAPSRRSPTTMKHFDRALMLYICCAVSVLKQAEHFGSSVSARRNG